MISTANKINLNGRYKITILKCSFKDIDQKISKIKNDNVPVINIGKEVAQFISDISDLEYINIELQDFIYELIGKYKSDKVPSNNIIALYNLGILLEPSLELNTTNLLKEISKSTEIIIIWDSEMETPGLLHWSTNKEKFHIDFSNIILNND